MNKPYTHKQLIRERLTLLLVVFFCVLISSSEYLVQFEENQGEQVKTEQHQDDESSEKNGSTFIHTAVDAVVPFVGVVMDQVFHFMYEIFGGEAKLSTDLVSFIPSSNAFFEILFERIISTNAP